MEKLLLSLLITLESNFSLTQDLLNRIELWATRHRMEFPDFLLRRHCAREQQVGHEGYYLTPGEFYKLRVRLASLLTKSIFSKFQGPRGFLPDFNIFSRFPPLWILDAQKPAPVTLCCYECVTDREGCYCGFLCACWLML